MNSIQLGQRSLSVELRDNLFSLLEPSKNSIRSSSPDRLWLSSSPYRDTAPFPAPSPLRTYPRSDAVQAPYGQDMTTLSRRAHARLCQVEKMLCILVKSCGVTLDHTTLMQHAQKRSPWLTIARSRHGWEPEGDKFVIGSTSSHHLPGGTGPTARYHPAVTLPLSIISNPPPFTSFAANYPACNGPSSRAKVNAVTKNRRGTIYCLGFQARQRRGGR